MNVERILEDAQLDFPRLLRSRGEVRGAWESVFSGGAIGPMGFRSYETGDPAHDILPQSLLRARFYGNRDMLLVRKHVGRRAMRVWIFLDLDASLRQCGSFASLHANPARESALLFSALVASASLFWRIPMGFVGLDGGRVHISPPQKDLSHFKGLLERIQLLRGEESLTRNETPGALIDEFPSAKGSLVFFVSDFASHGEDYSSLFDKVRYMHNVDVVPVFVDTSWIWGMFRGTFEIAGVEGVSGKPVNIITNQQGRAKFKEDAEEHKEILGSVFTRISLPWICLGMPNISTFEEEMTRCFQEKQRSR